MTFADTHPPVPEDPSMLEGPEVGELVLFTDRYMDGRSVVVAVEARSYVWAPEQPASNGYYGIRHYDWSVIRFLSTGHTVVVNDRDLRPIRTTEEVTA